MGGATFVVGGAEWGDFWVVGRMVNGSVGAKDGVGVEHCGVLIVAGGGGVQHVVGMVHLLPLRDVCGGVCGICGGDHVVGGVV